MDHMLYQYKALDEAVRTVLRSQCMDKSSPFYGAVEQITAGYTGGHSAVSVARQLIDGFYMPGCTFYKNPVVLERAALAMKYALNMQHEDGTLDLLETNFHDAAETSFIMQTIGPTYILMRERMGDTEEEKRLDELLYLFVNNAANGIISGGFHTPNHRWVLSAALAMCNKITGREDCLVKMRKLLDEGIDCDEEGEYTERSSGVYNVICDRALITLAEICGMTELYDHVTRNLKMVLKYIEPDYTINTLNSTRQDVGTAPDWKIYYSCYLYMALRTKNEEFLWIADRMLEQSLGHYSALEDCTSHLPVSCIDFLPFMLMDESLVGAQEGMAPRKPELNYVKHFVKSGIVRARKGDFSLTLMENRPLFAVLQYKEHIAYLRLAGCFYAKGQFAAQSIEETDKGFLMTYKIRWGYKGPLPEKPKTSVWSEMDHSLRPQVFMQDFILKVHVTILESGAQLEIESRGVECVPTKLEIMLQPGGRYITENVEMNTRGGEYAYQKCDKAVYQYGDHHKLLIEGGYHKDCYGEKMRGTLQRDDKSFFVALTAATPVKETVTLRFE